MHGTSKQLHTSNRHLILLVTHLSPTWIIGNARELTTHQSNACVYPDQQHSFPIAMTGGCVPLAVVIHSNVLPNQPLMVVLHTYL